MGLVVSGLCAALNAVFCACSFAKCCCTGGMGADGIGPGMAKFSYVVLLGLGTIIAYIVGRFGENEVEKEANLGRFEIFKFSVACEDITGQTSCSGDPAIFRASAACVCFFGVMFLGTLPFPTFQGDKSWRPLLGEGFHRGFWGIKILIFFFLVIGSFFVPIDDGVYTGVARFVSALFLVLQVLVLIDFAYTWNDAWLERSGMTEDSDGDNKGWLYALLAISFLLYAAIFGGLITLFIFYKECRATLAFTCVTLILVVVFVILTAFRERLIGEQASIAPAAVIGAYVVFLTWSASQSNPDISEDCHPFESSIGKNGWEIAVGIGIATLTLLWTAFTVSNNAKSLLNGSGPQHQTTADAGGAYAIGTDEAGKEIYARDVQDNENETSENNDDALWVFHLIMITASFYMAMVLTNWGVSETEILNNGSEIGNISMWVKIAAEWAAAGLFIWTLVAPAVLPDRDW